MSVPELMASFVFGMSIFYFGLSFYTSWKAKQTNDQA
jgi:hypothetical protein